jgi:endonuclease/exonuclease/phosphatase family metal-dependent hydrolase
LVSWNVAGRARRRDEQAEALFALDPDLVCLQEVTTTSGPRWTAALAEAGLAHAAVAAPGAPEPGVEARRRPLSVLIASRREITVVPIPDVPWPERVLAVQTQGLELVNVHSPISPSPGLAKVLTHETVHQHLAAGSGPRIVCGDFNTPRRQVLVSAGTRPNWR